MYFNKEFKLVALSDYITVSLKNDFGYLYIPKSIYDKIARESIDENSLVNKERLKNVKLYSDILDEAPLSNLRGFAYLIENNLGEVSFEEYISKVSYVLIQGIVLTNTLDKLIEMDVSFNVPKSLVYKKMCEDFFKLGCVELVDVSQIQERVAIQPQYQPIQVSKPESEQIEGPEWEFYVKNYPDCYIGYGEFKLPNGDFIGFAGEDYENIEKILGNSDPEPEQEVKEEKVEEVKEESVITEEEAEAYLTSAPKYLIDIITGG